MKLRTRRVLLFSLAAILAIPVVGKLVYRAEADDEARNAVKPVGEYRPQRLLNALPPIKKPPFVSVDEANGKIAPNELVLGVQVNGEARAFPINMLTGPRREIFNDELGQMPIAATW